MLRSPLASALVVVLLLALATPAIAQDDPDPKESEGSASLIIGFETALPEQVEALEFLNDTEIVHVSPEGAYIAVETDVPRQVELAALAVPGVAYVEQDQTYSTQEVIPDDTRYGQQYGPEMMGAHAAWDAAGFGGTNITVAVLDTGTRHGHQDLTPVGRFEPTQVYTGNASDNCGHGTHVAGTIAATTDNALGVAGMAQAQVQTYKVLDQGALFLVGCSGSTSAIAQAVYDAADNGADIISMSLGGGGYSQTIENAVDHAWASGVIVVAASGNDGASNSVSYPAAYDNAIAVGALDPDKGIASYSNRGTELDIVAPGSDVLSTYNGSDASYSTFSGTSMATPHVSGALALAWSCARRPPTSRSGRHWRTPPRIWARPAGTPPTATAWLVPTRWSRRCAAGAIPTPIPATPPRRRPSPPQPTS